MADSYYYEIMLRGKEEDIKNFLQREKLNDDEICLIMGCIKVEYLSLVLPDECNRRFFEQAIISNRIDIMKFLLQKYPEFDLKSVIRQLFYFAFVQNENWEMTKFLEELGFVLVENLSAFFVMINKGENFKKYCQYLRA